MSNIIELDVTSKIAEYLNSYEGQNKVKSIAESVVSSRVQPPVSSETIKYSLVNYLNSIEGKKQITQCIVCDMDVGSKIANFLRSYDGKQVIKGMFMELNDTNFDRKIGEFCKTQAFRDYIKDIAESETFIEYLNKQGRMTAMISTKVNNIVPKQVEYEIKQQLEYIIQNKINTVLLQEINKILPQLVQTLCNQIIPVMVQNLVQSNLQTMVPQFVQIEMQNQFPLYLNNNPAMQMALNNHIVNLNQALSDTANQQLAQIVSNEGHHQLVNSHLQETLNKCGTILSQVNTQVNDQLQKNAQLLANQYDTHNSFVSQRVEEMRGLAIQNMNDQYNIITKQLNDKSSTISSLEKNATRLNHEIETLNTQLSTLKSYLTYGFAFFTSIFAFMGYSLMNNQNQMPIIKFK